METNGRATVTPTSEVSNTDVEVSKSNNKNKKKSASKPRRSTSGSTRGSSTVSFHGLNKVVSAPAPKRRCCCGTVPKQILHDISGIFRPGMNAIMGPTGSGKTSLLDVIAGRTETKGVTGHLLINGQKPPKNFKCMTGYVVQDDVVMGTLTVRENFMFSANLRLPKKISHKEKCSRVEDTIQELGLTSCADSKIGNEFIRGVSGGERKRTNIGMELIISPQILFLDEPTTGLDASTAFAVISLLHSLSLKGRTIIFSIHQPRFTIFKLFDRLSLLAAGYTVFHGPAMEALDFLKSIGYECEEHNNPADFFLDVINGDSTAVQSAFQSVALESKEHDDLAVQLSTENHVQDGEATAIEMEQKADDGVKSLSKYLANEYASSQWAQRVKDELQPIMDKFTAEQQSGIHKHRRTAEYATSFLAQLRYVSQRALVNLVRNPQASMLQIGIAIFFSTIIGIIYLQVDDSYPAGLQNRVGAMFFMIMNQVFSNLSGLELFIKERVVFAHESASGFYRVSSYFFAKVFCDFVPMRFIPLIAFTIIAYFMIGFQMDVAKFFIFFLTLFLTTMSASAICFAVSSTVSVFAIANLLAVLIFIIMMIFGGLLVNIESLDDWISWLQYLSIMRYALNMLEINELKGMSFYQEVGNTTVVVITGEEYLDSQGIAHETAWDQWQNIMALGLIAIGVMGIAYIQLRRMKKLK